MQYQFRMVFLREGLFQNLKHQYKSFHVSYEEQQHRRHQRLQVVVIPFSSESMSCSLVPI